MPHAKSAKDAKEVGIFIVTSNTPNGEMLRTRTPSSPGLPLRPPRPLRENPPELFRLNTAGQAKTCPIPSDHEPDERRFDCSTKLLGDFASLMDNYLSEFLLGLADYEAGFGDDGPIGPHSRSRVGDTPLHLAAIQGNVRALSLLLDAGADIGAAGETGYTPLHYAVEQERPEAVRVLLERGADLSLRAETGATPSELAQHFHNHEIQRLLQQHVA